MEPVRNRPNIASSNYTVLPSISEDPSPSQSEVRNPDYKSSNFSYKPTPSPRSKPNKPISIVDIDLDVQKSSEVQNSSYISGGKLPWKIFQITSDFQITKMQK